MALDQELFKAACDYTDPVNRQSTCMTGTAFMAGAAFERKRILALLRSEETRESFIYGHLEDSPVEWANWIEGKLNELPKS